jgi:hypothetical protein
LKRLSSMKKTEIKEHNVKTSIISMVRLHPQS